MIMNRKIAETEPTLDGPHGIAVYRTSFGNYCRLDDVEKLAANLDMKIERIKKKNAGLEKAPSDTGEWITNGNEDSRDDRVDESQKWGIW